MHLLLIMYRRSTHFLEVSTPTALSERLEGQHLHVICPFPPQLPVTSREESTKKHQYNILAACSSQQASIAGASHGFLTERLLLMSRPAARLRHQSMASTAVVVPPVSALSKHPQWLLGRWGFSSSQLSDLLRAAAKLEQLPGNRSLAEPPEPWRGTAEQKQALKKLKHLLSETWPGAASYHDMVWQLRQSGFSVAAAERRVAAMLRWRQEHGLLGLTVKQIAAELSTGKVYAHHHPDVQGRPVFVVRACRHVPGEFSAQDTRQLFTVVVDEAIKQLQPGQDQFVGIIDLKGFTMSNVDLGFGSFVIEAFLAMYHGRLAQIVLVDAPWFFKGPWEVIKALLGRHVSLVCFASRQQLAKQFFTPDTLPDDFRK